MDSNISSSSSYGNISTPDELDDSDLLLWNGGAAQPTLTLLARTLLVRQVPTTYNTH